MKRGASRRVIRPTWAKGVSETPSTCPPAPSPPHHLRRKLVVCLYPRVIEVGHQADHCAQLAPMRTEHRRLERDERTDRVSLQAAKSKLKAHLKTALQNQVTSTS